MAKIVGNLASLTFMSSNFPISSFLLLIGCLAFGGLYAWFLYSSNKSLTGKLRIWLSMLRVLVVSSIAFLLFAPLFKFIDYKLQKPVIIIGQDNSISIAQVQPKGFNLLSYQSELEKLQRKLTEKFDVQVYHFGDEIGSGFDFSYPAKATNLSAFLKRIEEEYTNKNIGAVILATDGIYNKGNNPLYDLQNLKAPIYSIALGDTIPKRDALVSNINFNNIVYLGDSFVAETQVTVYDGDGETIQVSLRSNGKTLQTKSVTIVGTTFVKTIPFVIKAGKKGVQKFTVAIRQLPNEVTVKNNVENFYVEVIDGFQKVLLAAGAPHPDLTVLKDAISKNKRFEVSMVLAENLESLDPKVFDVLILYQLPDNARLSKSFLNQVDASNIPTWHIVGAQTSIDGFNRSQKIIELNRANGRIQEVYPVLAQNFTNFNLAQNDLKIIGNLDPLLLPSAKMNIPANASVMLNQRIDKTNTNTPLWFFVNSENQKKAFLMGEGLWRWKLNEAQQGDSTTFVQDLISKTVQYLSVKDDKSRFKITSTRNSYEENDEVLLNANLFNKSYEPINTSEVNLVLKDEAGKNFNYVFSKTEKNYQLTIPNLPEGSYTFVGTTLLGKEKLVARGGFFVSALLAEYKQTTANHQLLNAMAKQSGGEVVLPQNLLALADAIFKSDNVKTVSYEDRRYVELINLKWLFALILALLSTEWFLRKRNGEV